MENPGSFPNDDEQFPITPGITVDFFPDKESVNPQETILYNEAAFDLLHAITNSGVPAIWYSEPAIARGAVVVVVGERPNRQYANGLQSTGEREEKMARGWLDDWIEKHNPQTNNAIK